MKCLLFILFSMLLARPAAAQDTSATRFAALPITDYMVSSDSVDIVQVLLPAGLRVASKQTGLLKGTYRGNKSDTVNYGFGRCQLIKGDYYYFGIRNTTGRKPVKGDLVYTFINKTDIYFDSFAALASQGITLQNGYGDNLYAPLTLLLNWTKNNEAALKDSLVADIRFTGISMKELTPAGNIKISTGKYKDKLVFDCMQQATKTDLDFFLEYMSARPRLYAGNAWKISEIFATWVNAGAPVVVK